MYELYGDFD